MCYVAFASASKKYIRWMRQKLDDRLGIKGHITQSQGKICEQLKYAKRESLMLLRAMYSKKGSISLSRKRLKVAKGLAILGEKL
jgi:hypothetical protein